MLPIPFAALLLGVAIAPQDDLDARLERLQMRLEAARIDAHVPGMALAVVKDGKVILARGFGLADVESGEPVTSKTVFSIGSVTKSFTSALVGMLTDEGAMDWDDPVREHLPWFRLPDAAADAKVTVRDLLCHRTGLTRMGMLWASAELTSEQVLRKVADGKLYAPFRTMFLYTNVMYLAAGEAAAAAAGSTWEDLLQQRILDPLGMAGTHISADRTTGEARSAQGYIWEAHKQDWLAVPVRDIGSCAPAGAIFSDVEDMARWLRFQLARGEFEGRRLIEAKTLEETWKPHTPMMPGANYGLGWMLREWEGRKVVEHGGNIDGYAAQVGMIPEAGLGYVLLMNVTASKLQSGSLEIVWDSLLGPADVAVAPRREWSQDELEDLAGHYLMEGLDVVVSVRVEDGGLTLEIPGQGGSPLEPPGPDGVWSFAAQPETKLRFSGPDDGPAEYLLMVESGFAFEMPRFEPDPELPTAAELWELRRLGLGLEEVAPPRTLTSVGTVDYQHQAVQGRTRVVASGFERFRESQDMGAYGNFDSGSSSEGVWSESTLDMSRILGGGERDATLARNPWLLVADWRETFDQVIVQQLTQIEGRNVYSVRVSRSGRDISLYDVDAETGLVVRETTAVPVFGIAIASMSYGYSDYRDVDGVQMPFRIQLQNMALGDVVFQVESWSLDAPLAEADFARPAAGGR